jgi:hypothetical protein
MSLALAFLAPATPAAPGFHISGTLAVIVIILAVLGAFAILGWRAPDRSPGLDSKAERERIDD